MTKAQQTRQYPWHFNAWATAVALAQRHGWHGVILASFYEMRAGRRSLASFQLGTSDEQIADWVVQVNGDTAARLDPPVETEH